MPFTNIIPTNIFHPTHTKTYSIRHIIIIILNDNMASCVLLMICLCIFIFILNDLLSVAMKIYSTETKMPDPNDDLLKVLISLCT